MALLYAYVDGLTDQQIATELSLALDRKFARSTVQRLRQQAERVMRSELGAA